MKILSRMKFAVTLIVLVFCQTTFAQVGPITGSFNICGPGNSVALSDTTPGGTWASSNTSVATVSPSSGVVTGVSTGAVIISYVVGASYAVAPLTVNVAPGSITGTPTLCTGTTTTLSCGPTGGTWTSASPSVATAGSSSGIVTGVSAGTVLISYIMSSGCYSTVNVSVNASPTLFTVTGGGPYCSGGSGVPVGLNGSQVGVNYQLFNGPSPIGATVSGTGSAISFGLQVATGTYTVVANYGGTCAPTMNGTATISVNALPVVFSVTGGGTYCTGGPGADIHLSGSAVGINYSLYNSGAFVSTVSGSSSALDFGSQLAGSYSVVATNVSTSCSKIMADTVAVTANPLPAAYSVTGGGPYCFGGTGVAVGLNNSDAGISYQLYTGGVPIGSPVAGFGTSFSFGSQTASGTYTVVATNTSTGCTNAMAGSAFVTVNPLPATISGPSTVCMGATISLTDGTPGGTWSSTNPTVASVSGGSVSGLTTGTAAISYTLPTGCAKTAAVTVNLSPSISGGAASLCMGSNTTFTSTIGGTWSCAPSSEATIGSSSGTVTPISPGVVTITCTYSGCSSSTLLTINPSPAAISGPPTTCVGNTVSMTDVTTSGTWSTSTPAIGSISSLGSVSAVSAGNMLISYTLPAGCRSVYTLTVVPAPCDTSALPFLCVGNTFIVPHPCLPSGGTWTSGFTSIATIGSMSGMVTGVAAGVAPLTYTLPGGGCAMSQTITVNTAPAAISGPNQVCSGLTIGLFDATPGGTWSSSNTLVATVGTSGTVTGVSAGTALIRYTTSSCSASKTVTVNALPTSYPVLGGGSYCSGGIGVDVSLAGSEPGNLYQLYNGSTPVGPAQSGTGGPIDFGNQTAAGLYTIKASNGLTSCSSIMTGSASVSINPPPSTFTVTGGGSYCPGGSGVVVGLAGSQPGATYQLIHSSIPAGTPLSGTGGPLSFGPQLLTGAYTVMATTAGGCTATMSGSATVAEFTPPSVFALTGGGHYCSGDTGRHIYLSGSQSATLYRLFDGATLVDTMTGSGSSLDFGLFTAAGVYTVTATSSTTTCSSNMAGSVTIAVDPLPGSFSVTGGGNYCAGGTGVHVGLSGSVAGINYRLYMGISPVGGTQPGTGLPLDFGLETLAGAYTAIATNASTGCMSGMSGSATVDITPAIVPSVSVTASAGDTICAGTADLFTAVPINGGATPIFKWYIGGVFTGVVGTSYVYSPVDGDIVTVKMISSATCASPDTVAGSNTMTVNPHPSIVGPGSVCVGSAIILTSSVGSTWTSGAPTIATAATVGTSTGVITGLAPGVTTITCLLSGCTSTTIVTVNALPSVSVAPVRSCGGITTLNATGAASYIWSPAAGLSCTTCSSPNANPAASLTYTVAGTGGNGCFDTATVLVDGNRISGYISYGSSPYDTFRVWLFRFDPLDSALVSEDSTLSCLAGGMPYYEFRDKGPGDYMVQAKLLGQPYSATGYVPTYGSSTNYWSSGQSISHNNATDTQHINMVYGMVPAGPGSISGNIASGAAKGTTVFVAAPNVLVYLKDAVTNFVIGYTYTDGFGNYSFYNIATGNYLIYPEDFSYHTTQSATVSLTSSADTARHIDFRIYTISRLILPIDRTGISSVNSRSSLTVYPNPGDGKFSVKWTGLETVTADMSISDMLGHNVLAATLDITARDGETPVNAAHLPDGIYFLSIHSGQLNYSVRLVVSK